MMCCIATSNTGLPWKQRVHHTVALADPLGYVLDLAETNKFIDFTNHDCFTCENTANARVNLRTDKQFPRNRTSS